MLNLKNKKVLFSCRFGSHLYGTATPKSDYDEKGIFLETLENIVLGRTAKTHNFSTGNDDSRNSKVDSDFEYKELRTYLHEAMAGQTWAIDMLFCNVENTLQTSELWQFIQENRDKLLSKNIKPFIGYCRQQAGKYGLKGSRLKALDDVINVMKKLDHKDLIEDLPAAWQLHESEFVKWDAEFFEVLGKKFQRTLQIGRALLALTHLRERYGNRAELAMENNGVDWKAVSHAYRCMFEVKDLLTSGEIVFPLASADFLIQVKTGQIAWPQANDELGQMMDEIEGLAITSSLPEKPDYKFWDNFVLDIYINGYKA